MNLGRRAKRREWPPAAAVRSRDHPRQFARGVRARGAQLRGERPQRRQLPVAAARVRAQPGVSPTCERRMRSNATSSVINYGHVCADSLRCFLLVFGGGCVCLFLYVWHPTIKSASTY